MSVPNVQWKTRFKPRQTVQVEGIEFEVAHIGKRGLVLHRPTAAEARSAKAALEKSAWLKGEA
jgi:hypothetical protein